MSVMTENDYDDKENDCDDNGYDYDDIKNNRDFSVEIIVTRNDVMKTTKEYMIMTTKL